MQDLSVIDAALDAYEAVRIARKDAETSELAAHAALNDAKRAVTEAETRYAAEDQRLAAAGRHYDDVCGYTRCRRVLINAPPVPVDELQDVVIVHNEDCVILVRPYGYPGSSLCKFVYDGANWIEYSKKDYYARCKLVGAPPPND